MENKSVFEKCGILFLSRHLYLPKILSYSSSISSTIWFWQTMWTAMLPVSVSGLSSVGPNTMATLCVVMRLASPWSTTLERRGDLKIARFINSFRCSPAFRFHLEKSALHTSLRLEPERRSKLGNTTERSRQEHNSFFKQNLHPCMQMHKTITYSWSEGKKKAD